jgi:hypothetical protein
MRRLGALKPRIHVGWNGLFARGEEVDAARGRVVPEVVVCALYCCDLGEGVSREVREGREWKGDVQRRRAEPVSRTSRRGCCRGSSWTSL